MIRLTRFVVRVAGAIGMFIAALAICIAGIYAVSLGFAGLILLRNFSEHSPELGIPIFVALVAFCLYCGFRGEKVPPRKDVLRGPIVIKTDEHTIFAQPQQGSGVAPPEANSEPSSCSNDFRQPHSH